MPDDPLEAAESAETAQGAVESETTAPPWGDDFSPEKAWNTITQQRESEKELKERLRQAEQVWEDEKAAVSRFEERFPHLVSEAAAEEEDDDDDDEPQFLTRQEFEEKERQRELAESNRAFAQDLKEFTSERELSKHGRDLIVSRYQRGDFKNASDLQAALKEWYEWEDSLREDGKRSRQKPPTPPTPPGAGKAGDQEFDRRNATAAQRKAQREARIAAAVEAAQQP